MTHPMAKYQVFKEAIKASEIGNECGSDEYHETQPAKGIRMYLNGRNALTVIAFINRQAGLHADARGIADFLNHRLCAPAPNRSSVRRQPARRRSGC